MEIPIEQIVDKLLTNRLISRKTVALIAGLWALMTIIENMPYGAQMSWQQVLFLVAQLVCVAGVTITGIVTQARLDAQNGHEKAENMRE